MIAIIVLTILIISIAIQLSSHRKDKYQRVVRSVFYRPLWPGQDIRGYGSWYYGAWDVGEKLNESLEKSREQSAHRPPLHYSHHKQGRHHQKHH